MAVDADTFRAVLGQWPTGVGVVTTCEPDDRGAPGRWHGMTASSFSSVSLDPPLVLVCLARHIHTHRLIERSGVFAVSFLGKDHTALGRRFAGLEPGDRFSEIGWHAGPTGAPVLDSALGWLDCRVAHAYPGGDHTIFVGEVLAAAAPRRTAPLLFHSRAWGQLADPLPEQISIADTGLAAALHNRNQANGNAPKLLGAVRAAGVRTRLYDHSGSRSVGSLVVADMTALHRVPEGMVVEGYDIEVLAAARARGLPTVGRVADAFAPVREAAVLCALEQMVELGCDEIALDEGPNPASPLRVRHLLQDAVARTRPVPLRVLLREACGLGLVNALTAMKSGVRNFDVTLGGVDGGLCAEDVLFLAAQLNVATPIDSATLAAAAADLKTLWGSALPGRTYRTTERTT